MHRYIKIESELSGLHLALVEYLYVLVYNVDEGEDNRVIVHSMCQVGDTCKLSVEVREPTGNIVFINIII